MWLLEKWSNNLFWCSIIEWYDSDSFLVTRILYFNFLPLAPQFFQGSSSCLLSLTNSTPGMTSSNFFIDWPFKPCNYGLCIYILMQAVMLSLCSFSIATFLPYLSSCSSISFVSLSFFFPCIMTLKLVINVC